MITNGQWYLFLLGVLFFAVIDVAWIICWFIFKDRSIHRLKSPKRDALGLLIVVATLALGLYSLYAFSDTRWHFRFGDGVEFQPERWIFYVAITPFLIGAVAYYLGMQGFWGYITAGLALIASLIFVLGAVTSTLMPLFCFAIGGFVFIIVILVVITKTQRDSDRMYWIIWALLVVSPLLYGGIYLIGSIVLGAMDKTLEIGLLLLADFMLFGLLPILMIVTWGGKVVNRVRKFIDQQDPAFARVGKTAQD